MYRAEQHVDHTDFPFLFPESGVLFFNDSQLPLPAPCAKKRHTHPPHHKQATSAISAVSRHQFGVSSYAILDRASLNE
jgi:hypothetical protein